MPSGLLLPRLKERAKLISKKIGIKAKYILILFTKHCIIKKSYERRYGGIAQLVRAHGSHPWGRRFEPCCLHQAGLGAECALSVYLFLSNAHATKPAFFSSSIQRDAGPNSFWVRRYFLCLTARPNSSSSFSVPLYSGEWPQTKRALCFFQSVLSFSLAYSRHHYCWFCEQRMVNSY